MKTCTKCGELKPATTDYFSRDSTRRDGLQGWCKPCMNNQSRKWHRDNPEYKRQYRQENLENVREYFREYRRKRYQDVGCRVSLSISHGMRKCLRDGKGGKHWETLVGYTAEELMAHLESQFTKGMTWDNYGAWHIDHIRPISHFNFASCDDPEFLECWSLWNLQPRWAKDNLSKSNKCDAPPLPLLQ